MTHEVEHLLFMFIHYFDTLSDEVAKSFAHLPMSCLSLTPWFVRALYIFQMCILSEEM